VVVSSNTNDEKVQPDQAGLFFQNQLLGKLRPVIAERYQMGNEEKTKKQLLAEVRQLQRRRANLQAAEMERKRAEKTLFTVILPLDPDQNHKGDPA
jgi:hypothetical protein